MTWTEGTILGEDTKLLVEVERADGRTLWFARDEENRRDVMVEVADGGARWDSGALLAFHSAAESAIALRHPSLSRVFDHGLNEAGLPYVIRERMPSCNFVDEVTVDGALGLRRGANLIERLLRVVDLLHVEGLARAGVTPDQVFLDGADGNEVKLWIQLVTTGPTAVAQKLGCVAPERLEDDGWPTDVRSSLWEIGALAYYALTGRGPFEASDPASFFAAVRSGRHARIALRGDGGEASRIELDGFFRRALAADPDDRFQTAREMLDAWSNVVGALLLFVDADDVGRVTFVPTAVEAAPEDERDSWVPTAIFDRDELPSILDFDEEEDTVISVRGDELEAPSDGPPPVVLPSPPMDAAPEPASTRTVLPISRTVAPPSRSERGLSPMMWVAGVIVAALSSATTSWLSEAPARADCDCPAEVSVAAPQEAACPASVEPLATAAAPTTKKPRDETPTSAAVDTTAPASTAKRPKAIWPATSVSAKKPPEAVVSPAAPVPAPSAAPKRAADADDPYAE